MSGPGFEIDPAVLLIHGDIFSNKSNLASIGHGVPGVEDQVHNDLFDVTFISLDSPETVVQVGFENNVFSNQALKHFE